MCSSNHEHSHDHEHSESMTISRRDLLSALGVAAGTAALAPLGVAPAGAATSPNTPVNVYKPYRYQLAGDHHIHTTYSRDAMYETKTQVKNAETNGLAWMVITDHGATAHQKLSIDQITPEIIDARKNSNVRVFQGLEWNIPGAEHATLILPPSSATVQVLKEFEKNYDGQVLADAKITKGLNTSDGEKYAVEGIKWLGQQIEGGRIPSALVFANHPARKGLDSPHEVRAWRDAYPGIAVGWEGAPGHQMAAHPTVQSAVTAAGSTSTNGRGYYDNSPNADSFPGYAPTATENPYRTYGGFDWFTSKVGGLWDSLLAEGLPWWITANSDSHTNYNDSLIGTHLVKNTPGSNDSSWYNLNGNYGAPIDSGIKQATYGDFAPGAYSSTIVTSFSNTYRGIMASLKAGNIIVTHGGLIAGADVRVYSDKDKRGVTTGGRTFANKGDNVTAIITVSLATIANGSGSIPKLKNVQLIGGPVTGPVSDKDTMLAPQTSILKNFEVTGNKVTFEFTFKNVQKSFYIRYRGNNGVNLDTDGLNPKMDVMGNSNPWLDLWFYTNPIFIDVI